MLWARVSVCVCVCAHYSSVKYSIERTHRQSFFISPPSLCVRVRIEVCVCEYGYITTLFEFSITPTQSPAFDRIRFKFNLVSESLKLIIYYNRDNF